jgi:threonine aldolase
MSKIQNELTVEFASDNTSGICPEAWEALALANQGAAPSYGEDTSTEQAADAIREFFDTDCEVFFCFNGTAANSMSLAQICRPFHSIVAHPAAHIENDECGAPEFFSHGSKLLLAPGAHGQIEVPALREIVGRRTDMHFPKPRVLSLTQATELGTCYAPDDLTALCASAHELGLSVHMDGARLANALAALRVSPAELTWKAGVDVLCLGGTKNGLALGDAVVFFDRELCVDFEYRCKQAGQLASKMRFLTAPFARLLQDGSWLRHAQHANRCAERLAQELSAVEGFELIRPQQVNSAFFRVDTALLARLRDAGLVVHDFIGGGVRFMCSWATTDEQIDRLIALARAV